MTGWLVAGAGGMLGQDMVSALRARSRSVLGLDSAGLDITDQAAVGALIASHRPDVVVNCAAWTAVDAAEADEQSALAVNGRGPKNLAEACAATGARLVQVSTDYVFRGDATQPYETDDTPEPRTAYGRTKLVGERTVLALLPQAGLVVRTSWLYGGAGPSFVHTMIRLAGSLPTVDVVTDQRGQPTWTADVADQIMRFADARVTGICHATSSGETTWHDLAREVFGLLGADPERVRPTTGARSGRLARRPEYSVLGHRRHAVLGIEPIGDWRAALHRAWPHLASSPGSDDGPKAARVGDRIRG